MNVAFYDRLNNKLIDIEPQDWCYQTACVVAAMLTEQWIDGVRLPSPIWVAWGDSHPDGLGVFSLDERLPSDKVLERIKRLTDAWEQTSKPN